MKGERNNSVIKAIAESDTFLTNKEIRDALGVVDKANTGQYANITSAISYLRITGKVIGVAMYQKNGTSYVKTHLNGLPFFL